MIDLSSTSEEAVGVGMSRIILDRRHSRSGRADVGWHPTGRGGVLGEWDGLAWTGRSRIDPADGSESAGTWRVRVLPFLGHLWFWLMTLGLVATAVGGALGNSGAGATWWLPLATVGIAITMISLIAMVWPLLRLGELARKPLLIGAGIASGVVASYLAWGIQHFVWPAFGIPVSTYLWFTGPVEETSKLLVPVLLLVFSRRLFGDPRAGVLMALVSGAVFGLGEGIDYLQRATGLNPLLLTGLIRAAGELVHLVWPAFAAALIWLAAHRSGRILTRAAFVGWAAAVVVHSAWDGVGAGEAVGTHVTTGSSDVTDMTRLLMTAIAGDVGVLAMVALFVVALRIVARELVPPSAVLANPPRWRPRLKRWGVSAPVRTSKGDHDD